MILALCAYNLGSALVVTGTVLKARLPFYRMLVNSGGTAIGLSMALLLIAVRKAPASWTLAGLVVLAAIILVSMPIGLTLSAKRHH